MVVGRSAAHWIAVSWTAPGTRTLAPRSARQHQSAFHARLSPHLKTGSVTDWDEIFVIQLVYIKGF